MAEKPQWLTQANEAKATFSGLPGVAGESTKNQAIAMAESAQKAIQTLNHAWESGNADEDYILALFKQPLDLILHAMDLVDQEQPVILRPLTAREIMQKFSYRPNSNGSQNFPLGLTVSRNPQPIDFDLINNSGPTLVLGSNDQSVSFLNKLRASAIQANHRLVNSEWLDSVSDYERFFRSLEADELHNTMKAHQHCLILIPNIDEIGQIIKDNRMIMDNFNWLVNANPPFFHLIGSVDPKKINDVKNLKASRQIWLDLPSLQSNQWLNRSSSNHQGQLCWQLKD